ncbi:hypothetical protein ABPG77_002844 [Micractinium sp. CCAP 211/92]
MRLAVALAALLLAASVQAIALPPLQRSLTYKTILRTGNTAGKSPWLFGQIINKAGLPVYEVDESGHPTDEPRISNSPDFSSLIETYGPFGARKLFLITHFEAPSPAVQYVVELGQAPDGTLTPRNMKPVDWSALGGLWNPCAGSRTPWGSHIGGEEYEPDARPFSEATDLASFKAQMDASSGYGEVEGYMAYWDVYPADITLNLIKQKFNPYKYGHIHETRVDFKGNPTVFKWYTMGRLAFEMAYVLPDRKTVYLTDDGTNVGFYKFIATKPGDMSAGSLYAARFTQTAATNGGSFTIQWIKLGTGVNKDLRALALNTTFADIFETATYTDGTGCPIGFTSVNEGGRPVQCLKVKPGMDTAAAFLETRRYAGIKGATTEFSKWEGITYDPKRGHLYTSMTSIRYGMEDNKKKGAASTTYDKGGNNDVKLPYNPCGCVYKLTLDAANSATTMQGLFCGAVAAPCDPEDTTCNPADICDVNSISSPDNLSYMPEFDTLIVGEDTSDHQNDVMWSYNFANGSLDRIFSTPYGSETTSTYWYPNIRGSSYLMAVIQHPYGESDSDHVTDPESTGPEGWVGYFTWKTVAKSTTLKFQPIDPATTNEEKNEPLWSPKVTLYRADRTPAPLRRPARGLRQRWF